MLLLALFVVLAGSQDVSAHWHVKAEHICMEAAKNTTFDPLCASNGQTYQNPITFQCYVRYFEVYGMAARRGVCERNPEPDHCALAFVVWRRVCGADNITYSSVWELMCEAQRQRKWNAVQYDGPCRIQCPLTLEYKPVCSSENLDYPNLEALRCAALRKPQLDITLKKDGMCFDKDTSAHICQPKKGGWYKEKEQPVCANNGVTYATYNALACLRLYNRDLRILHDGPCTYKDVVIPGDARKVCSLADNNAIMMPVCGTDNTTYPNPFVLHCAKYRQVVHPDVDIRHEGACEDNMEEGEIMEVDEDPCEEVNASSSTMPKKKPLFCASDGRTYYTTKEYACAVKTNSDWYHYTITKVGVACDAKDSPCDKLRVSAEALVSDPICGNDGVTYINSLAFMCAVISEPSLRKHHRGRCLPR